MYQSTRATVAPCPRCRRDRSDRTQIGDLRGRSRRYSANPLRGVPSWCGSGCTTCSARRRIGPPGKPDGFYRLPVRAGTLGRDLSDRGDAAHRALRRCAAGNGLLRAAAAAGNKRRHRNGSKRANDRSRARGCELHRGCFSRLKKGDFRGFCARHGPRLSYDSDLDAARLLHGYSGARFHPAFRVPKRSTLGIEITNRIAQRRNM